MLSKHSINSGAAESSEKHCWKSVTTEGRLDVIKTPAVQFAESTP